MVRPLPSVGGDVGLTTYGGTLEGGYRFALSPVWLHAEIGAGGTWLAHADDGSGEFLQLRGGFETHMCLNPAVCMIPGVDVGIQVANFEGTAHGMPVHADDTVVVAIPRLQGDFGGSVRFRPGIEAVFDARGLSGVNATIGVAYRW